MLLGKKQNNSRALRRILRENAGLAALYVALGIVCAFLQSFGASYLQRMLDGFQYGTMTAALLLGYGGILAAQCVLEYVDNMPDVRLPNRIALGLKTLALRKMAVVDYRAQQGLGTGSLVQRIESGAEGGKRILYDYSMRMARELLPSVLFSLLFIAAIDRHIVLYVAAGYLVTWAISNLLIRRLYRIKERVLDSEEQFQNILVRGLMEMTVFRLLKRYAHEIRRAEEAAETITQARVTIRMVHEAFFASFFLLVILIKVLVLWIAWQSGAAPGVGALVALLALLDRAYQPIAIINVLYVQFRLDRAAFERLDACLSLPEDARLTAGEALRHTPDSVRLEHVTVRYDGRTALQDFSLELEPGKTVALVGESGCGKSTAAKLIAGLIRPDEGRILLNGQDMEHIALQDYYDHLAYVPQDPPVFQGTLRENLALDAPVPDAQLDSALRQVALGPLLDALPQGLLTPIGERGALLSGGERQRLALARLLCGQPSLVVLDESTSALDHLNERLVLQALRPFLKGRTVCMIAHRLHTLRDVDEILVLQAGRVAERGSFDSLIRQGGVFARMWAAAQKNTPFPA